MHKSYSTRSKVQNAIGSTTVQGAEWLASGNYQME